MRVSSKGQVTLPREIRKILASDVVTYAVVDGQVLLLPVRDVGGSLRGYGKGAEAEGPFASQRDEAWEKAARGKAARKHT
jgi:bifunctional DNA-binding transcriptional regulator/antitoxin component of YhaV-PrlF toxin-antitoxin module